MANFRRQIEETEAHFQSMTAHDGNFILKLEKPPYEIIFLITKHGIYKNKIVNRTFSDPEHLFDAIRKIHDVVVGLAAKYQPIHDGVKKEKEFCSILHRQVLKFQ
jgi:hypothetical protein